MKKLLSANAKRLKTHTQHTLESNFTTMANISDTRLDSLTGSSRIIPILDDPDSTNGEEQIASTKGMAVDGSGGGGDKFSGEFNPVDRCLAPDYRVEKREHFHGCISPVVFGDRNASAFDSDCIFVAADSSTSP